MIGAHWLNACKPGLHPAAQGSSLFFSHLRSASRPGVAPAGDSLFFASPKKSKQKKGDPQSGSPSGQPAVLEASGVWLNSLRSNNASPDPLPSALLGPARTGWRQSPNIRYRNSKAIQYTNEHRNSKLQEKHFHKYAPWRVLVGPGNLAVRFAGCSEPPPPRRNEEASSASADGSGLALSERSEFSQTPAALSNAAYRRSRATNPARLSFAYFSLAKQRKVSRLPGRHPACLRQTDVCKKAMTASVCMTAMTSAQPGATPACPHSTNAPQSFPTAPHRRRRCRLPPPSPPRRHRSKPQVNNRCREQRE